MKAKRIFTYKPSLSVAIFCIVSLSAGFLLGQTAPAPTWVTDDWSQHHLVFSNPGTMTNAVSTGTLAHWSSITNDLRYQIQQRNRSGTQQAAATPGWVVATPTPISSAKGKLKKDWSEPLGNAASLIGIIGALTSSSIGSSSTLTVDGVTFDASPPTPATGTLTMGSSSPTYGTTLVIGGITYNFSNSTLSTTQSLNTCGVEYSSTKSTAENNLLGAMTNGSSGSTKGTSAWECNSDVPTDSTVSVSSDVNTSGTHTITVAAVTPGSTSSIATPTLGLTGFTWASGASGTNGATSGTTSPPTFAYWSGSTYVSSAQVATNIATAINANTTLQTVSTGVSATANSPASDDVTITALAAGSGGDAYAVTPASFTAFTGGTLAGGQGGAVQPNAYPAKFSFSTTSASCSSDFVVYPTGVNGTSSAASIIAYNNLYTTGCTTGTVPSVYWAYNTGGTFTTSPILSFDSAGSQVAFIQVTGTAASLVLLKWKQNATDSFSSPETLTTASPSTYRGCSAPCMLTITFSGGHSDTLSSPFYDYHGDALYVGDDSGNLHQFTGVFNGTPAENTTSPWPVGLGSGNELSSPVYDGTWNAVFVGDLGGGLHCVTTTGPSGTCQSGQTSLGNGWYTSSTTVSGGQIADAPLVDSSANYLLAFVNTSTSNSLYGHSEQYFPSTFPGIVGVGTGATGHYLYAGTFDNGYYGSTSHTGNIYVVGNTGATTGATLFRVGIGTASGGFLNGAVTGVVTGLTTSGAYPWPSPVTEFCNNGTSACGLLSIPTTDGCTVTNSSANIACTTAAFSAGDVGAGIAGTGIPNGAWISTYTDTKHITLSATATATNSNVALTIGATTSGADYVFFSVNNGAKTGCTSGAGNGCVLSYNVSLPSSVAEAGSGLNVMTPGTNGCWATGGLIIDNSATTPTGASQIYFLNLNGITAGNLTACTAAGGTATNATQAAQSNP